MNADEAMREITLAVNGKTHTCKVAERINLADFLRQDLQLTGTHVGCEHGVCGACTVLVDGVSARGCLMLAVQADGCRVETVESLAAATQGAAGLGPLQAAFRDRHALQCGYCTPGILMSLTAFLAEHPTPDEAEIREALSGNLCRCTGYQHIVDAVLRLRDGAP
jgi:aerobic-type carbon monoxide dehydrogenase small subunit (CoxS/CutS family)